MNPLHRFRRALGAVVSRRGREREMDEEIRFHLEQSIAQHRARGLSEAEARRLALAEFGGVEAAKEGVREAWALARLAELGRDVRFALRGVRRRPAYAATVVITLALALGAAGSIWNALWSILARPLPMADDQSLYALSVKRPSAPDGPETVSGLSVPELEDLRREVGSFSGLVEYHSMNFTLLGHGEPRRVRVGVVSPEYFALLGIRPQAGRDFRPTDDRPGAPAVLLLAHDFWQREFGGEPALVGEEFSMNDRGHTVVGILPPLPALPEPIDVYMPVQACPFRAGEHWMHTRAAATVAVLGRLAPGATRDSATAELRGLAERLLKRHPGDYPSDLGLTFELTPLRSALTRQARPLLWLLAAAGSTVLLLVLANLLNLTVAQLQRRSDELAMRSALGGSRFRLARQLLVETTVLALLGGFLGLGLAFSGESLLARLLGRLTPRAAEMRFDLATVAGVVGMALAVGVTLGLVPALLRGRGEGIRKAARRLGLRDVLVVLQVAASFVLLTAALFLLGSLRNLERVPPGFEHREVLALELAHNWTKYAGEERQVVYAERLLDRVRAVPGVDAVALADTYPLNPNQPWSRRVALGEERPPETERGPTADFRIVSPSYFETVGIRRVEGRLFDDDDRDPRRPVAVVNRAFARALFPGRSPLGEKVTFANGNASWIILGVVEDVRQRGLGVEPRPELFVPMALSGMGDKRLLVRAAHADRLEASVRAAVRSVDPEQPIHGVRTLGEARGEALAAPRTTALLLGLAALVALVVAAAGLAGLLAYSLSQRQHEFAIRLALGAQRRDIARLVLGRTGRLVVLGALLGLGGSLFAARGFRTLLFGLQGTEPAIYLSVAAVLFTAAFAAALPSLRRALGTAPGSALRAL